MKEDLLPCPFCGSSDVEEDWGSVVETQKGYQYGDITCQDCGANVDIELTGEEVDADGEQSGSARLQSKWNTRLDYRGFTTKEINKAKKRAGV